MTFRLTAAAMGCLGMINAQQLSPDEYPISIDQKCVYPGTCTPPPTKYSWVAPNSPRDQWTIEGGFCGSLSIQSIALTKGAFISQDLIRKANIPVGNSCGEHGDNTVGYEVVPQNIAQTLDALSIVYDKFDHENAPLPQAAAYLGWMKQSLANQHPVVAFVMCMGDDPHEAYQCGPFDHIEPFWGLYSNHDLQDPAIYDDDYIVHGSDYGPDGDRNLGYFRQLNHMVDTKQMDGNCKNAQPNVDRTIAGRRNEMFPCFNDQQNYGAAIWGLQDPMNKLMPLYLQTKVMNDPDIRVGERAVPMDFTIHISGLTVGQKYSIKKYHIATWPKDSAFGNKASAYISFVASATTHVLPEQLLGDGVTESNSDAYFACFLASEFPSTEEQKETLVVLE